MIGCSDAHQRDDFSATFSYVYAREKSADDIIDAIKGGRVEYVTAPLPVSRFIREILWIVVRIRLAVKGE